MSILDANFDLNSGPRPSLRMTEEEFVEFGLEVETAEWVNGEVILKMPIDEAHDALQALMRQVVELFVKRRKLGRVYGPNFTTRLALAKKVVRRDPDVMFVSTASQARATRTVLDGPPELIVEIVSPESEFRDINEKYLEYEEAGVREYWIVNPASQQTHLFVYDDKTRSFARREPDAEGRLISSVIDGLWFDPRILFTAELPDAVELVNRIDPSILSPK